MLILHHREANEQFVLLSIVIGKFFFHACSYTLLRYSIHKLCSIYCNDSAILLMSESFLFYINQNRKYLNMKVYLHLILVLLCATNETTMIYQIWSRMLFFVLQSGFWIYYLSICLKKKREKCSGTYAIQHLNNMA